MIARAVTRYIRISPRKLRLVADPLRGKNLHNALAWLSSINKKASLYVAETLRSAFSNARRKMPDKKVEENNFYISRIICDGGPSLKRWRAASMGRAVSVKHRTSHLLVELDEGSVKKTKSAGKTAMTKTAKKIKGAKET